MYTSMSIINMVIRFLLVFALSFVSVFLTLILYQKVYLFKFAKKSHTEILNIVKNNFIIIFIKPIIEEMIFRYILCTVIYASDLSLIKKYFIFLFSSSLIFALAHLPLDKLRFVEKFFVGGLLYSFVYLCSKDIVLLIAMHMLHNLLIMLLRKFEDERKDGRNGK